MTGTNLPMKYNIFMLLECDEYFGVRVHCLVSGTIPVTEHVLPVVVVCVGVVVVLLVVSVVFAVGSRPVPFRTRKLSLPAPMVLHSGGCGRVGRCRHL